jgi:predicted DNA-binding protein (MmcQ/YjbR family)
MPRKQDVQDAAIRELRKFGLAYPGAHLKSPWPGHLDLAVNDKTFAYLSTEGEPFGISCKLPRSSAAALMLPFTKPTAYGLGRSGWVSARFPGKRPPIDLLKDWIDESYRAQAPKKLVAQLSAGPGSKPAGGREAAPGKQAAPKALSARRCR